MICRFLMSPGARRRRALIALLWMAFVSACPLWAEPANSRSATRHFDLAAGNAVTMLKEAAQQAGLEIVYTEPAVRGVRTNAVRGELTPREALEQMLAHTGLDVVQDDRTGAFAVRRESPNPAAAPAARKPAAAPPNEAVRLSPFEVRTEKDTSYGAVNSNAIVRFNTELKNAPISADVFTEDFMRDTGATSVYDLLADYGAGMGMIMSTPETDGNATQPGDRFSTAQVGTRGLSAGNVRRDGFESDATNQNIYSTFDTERVEVLKGPQGLLYGAGGAGGTVIASTKRARFNQKRSGVSFRVDRFGSKRTMLDTNLGGSIAAVRLAVLREDTQTRRLFVGNLTNGFYGQFAFQLPARTTLRLSGEYTNNTRIIPTTLSVNLGGTASDPRHGSNLGYLVYTGQAGAMNPLTGEPYPKGAIGNGRVTGDNYASYLGWATAERISNTVYTANLDTVWTDWLSSNIAFNYSRSLGTRSANASALTAPRTGNNPFDDWAVGSTFQDGVAATQRKQFRASVLLTKELFGGRLKNQLAAGYDTNRVGAGATDFQYYLSDASGQVLYDPAKPTDVGRTPMPTQWWPVGAGPVKRPFSPPGSATIFSAQDGRYYTRMERNPRDPAWIAPNNPLGLANVALPPSVGITGNNKQGYVERTWVDGYYFAEQTSWFGDRVTTLLGYRRNETVTHAPNFLPSGRAAFVETRHLNSSYNLGINVRLADWLNAYASKSSTYDQANGSNDPYGNVPPTTEGVGREFGLKFASRDNRWSGSLAYFTIDDRNQNFNYGTALRDLINPVGLNGAYDGVAGRNQWISLDKHSTGVELILSAAPTSHWRLRVAASQADGRIATDKSYGMLYNDQFYTDGRGGVTYRDGTPFLVPVDASKLSGVRTDTAAETVITPDTPAVQLTTAMMSDPASDYYAFGKGNAPSSNGRLTGTAVTAALRNFVSNGVKALTGATGLPISALQYRWEDPAHAGGTVVVARSGERTVGNAVYRVNFTTTYEFSEGWLKGFGVGGSLLNQWQNRVYYYNSPDGVRRLYEAPLLGWTVNPWLFYERTIGHRLLWRSQLNITNLFNHTRLELLPSATTGYSDPTRIGITFRSQPRAFAWTNTISF